MTIERTGYNNLRVQVYSSGTTPIYDPGELPRAEGCRFDTMYPGGRYGTASFFIGRDPMRNWALKQGQRVVLSNGLLTVWEGLVTSTSNVWDTDRRGRMVFCTGEWGDMMMKRRWRKIWADDRLTDEVWVWRTTASGADKCHLDRHTRIRFTPKAEAWANGDFVAVRYAMPTGETIKRIAYSYDLQEAAQVWEISVWRSTDGVSYTQMTGASGETYAVGTTTVIVASGTGSIDVTLATPSQYVQLRFYSRAAQTPTSDGTYYGQFSGITVYSETSSINGYEVAKDVVGILSELNSDETRLSSSLTSTLEPFIAEDTPTIADILAAAVAYGDTSFNAWGYGLLASEEAATPDGKPVLFLAQQPVLTDHEYVIYHEDKNLIAPLEIEWTLDDTWNSIIVQYQDADGRTQYRNAQDDANLKDNTSASDYGTRQYVLRIPGRHATSTTAINAGRRFLAQNKERKFRITGGITVQGYITHKSGYPVPACQIYAGQRVKIGDFVDDGSGTWQTHLITATEYDDTTETCRISVGVPDGFGIYLAQLERSRR